MVFCKEIFLVSLDEDKMLHTFLDEMRGSITEEDRAAILDGAKEKLRQYRLTHTFSERKPLCQSRTNCVCPKESPLSAP
jgi:hypothetical protein